MNSASTAVLAIDLQNDYGSTGRFPVEGYDGVLNNAACVLGAARRAGATVIHAQAWVEEESKSSYRLLHEGLADEFSSGTAGSDGAEFCRAVAPRRGEKIIRKAWPSAFRDTELAEVLARANVERLVTFGVWTESCVLLTVFDAVFLGFRVWLVKDACGSGTGAMHRIGVLDIANRLYGGGVLHTAEAVKALESRPHEAWSCSRPVEFRYTLETVDRLYEAL